MNTIRAGGLDEGAQGEVVAMRETIRGTEPATTAAREMTLIKHLEELRARIINAVVAVLAASCLVYLKVDWILAAITRPVGSLVFLSPAEAFVVRIKLALVGGAILAGPVILFEAWRFAAPALTPAEARQALLFLPAAFVAFFVGAAFSLLVAFPVAMKFLMKFATPQLIPMISIGEYVSFAVLLTVSLGLVFEMPLAILLLTRLGLVTPRGLAARRRYVILGVFVVAAVITPTVDMISQVLVAAPLWALFEIGVLLARFAG
ncbi:MAG: twin-arginine translocase subunit TatC [Firmicutes bacterium]|nr:twin-arginine translocase subunit TatC [Bacillota bacterium]